MPVCLYLRGSPGSGKNVCARILERDLGWPRLWVHHFDAVYRIIGEYKVPDLTDKLIRDVACHLMQRGRDFMVVRPSRQTWGMRGVDEEAKAFDYTFVPVMLTASYNVLLTRVTRRWSESPFRLTTKEALDEYLAARREEAWPGEHVIDTDKLTPEQVAGRIKELLPVVKKPLRKDCKICKGTGMVYLNVGDNMDWACTDCDPD